MPFEELTAQVAVLPTLISNIYFVGEPGGPWVLVDSGTPGTATKIREAACERYGSNARPAAIILTHGHHDHAGSAPDLADVWDVPVYAHRLERPFLTGKSAYPPKDPLAGGAFSFMSRFFPTNPIDLGSRLHDLPEAEVPGLPGWEAIFTPGHAPGHVALYHPRSRTVLAGDACTTMDLDSFPAMMLQLQRVSRPPAPFTYDWDQAHNSVERLAELRPEVIGAGHGPPMAGPSVAAELRGLADHFPAPQGRYAREAARTDENGVTYVPPAPPDPLPKIAAGAGLAAAALAAVVVISRRER